MLAERQNAVGALTRRRNNHHNLFIVQHCYQIVEGSTMVDGTRPNTTQHPRDHTTMSHKLELPGVCHGGGMKPLAAGPQDYTTMLHKQHTNMVPQDALRMLSPRAAGSRTTTACTTDCCPDIRRLALLKAESRWIPWCFAQSRPYALDISSSCSISTFSQSMMKWKRKRYVAR